MTDAREIIAHHLCEMAAQGWSGISPFERAAYRTTAQGMVGAIEAAGFRILGPDEVDQVTLEKCAAEVKHLRQLLHSQTITLDVGAEDMAYFLAEDMAYFLAEDAIRALGRKA